MGVDYMIAGNSVVKLTARTALKNNWLKCIAASLTLIFSCIILLSAADYAAYISNGAVGYILLGVGAVFLVFPLFLGLVRFFWRMIFGADDRLPLLFYYFSDRKKYGRALRLSLALALRAAGFAPENIHVVSSLDEAIALNRTLLRAGDVVMYENDLPDHYSEG